MLLASAWLGLVVAPQIAGAQRDAGVPISSLPAGDERRETVQRLHWLSGRLEMVPFLGGLALLFWELKD
jgi:hypothetical protein